MIIYENQCVDCQLPCLGTTCPLVNVPVVVCDICGEPAEYKIDGKDMCESCAKEYVNDEWISLSLIEKAQALKMEVTTI